MVSATIFDWLYHAGRWTWHDPDGYNFISGPLADVTLLGGAYAILRRHNCHAKGCLRIGRHPVDGTDYVVCRHHHPDESPTAEQIHVAHSAHRHALEEARAKGAAAVHDVREVAHEVAADVHQVAEDVHEAEERHEHPPPEEPD
ncbi:MAG: hypothetical protein ACJ764_07360 [Solirubrobacteraceae bacterium]